MTVHQPIAPRTGQMVWQLRVQDFLLLEDSGAFADDARAELPDGEIWVVKAVQSLHAAVQSELHGQLWTVLNGRADGLKTSPTPLVELGDRSLDRREEIRDEPRALDQRRPEIAEVEHAAQLGSNVPLMTVMNPDMKNKLASRVSAG